MSENDYKFTWIIYQMKVQDLLANGMQNLSCKLHVNAAQEMFKGSVWVPMSPHSNA